MTDILIKNGKIIDGTGNKAFLGNILINKDIISDIVGGSYSGSADIIIDANKKIVCPGFIDIHSHYDFSYLIDKFAEFSLKQGITTEIVGNCGLGLAPMNEFVNQYYKNYISFLLGKIETKPFNKIRDLMNYVSENGCSLNIGFLIPQGNVRLYVMGLEDRHPTDDELSQMKKLVYEGMEDGAFGLSTGLIYPPGSITPTEELIELVKVVGKFNGIYSTHIRDEGRHVVESIQEAIKIGNESGAAVQISHVKVAGGFLTGRTVNKILKLFTEAHESGLDINGDIYPYTAANTVLNTLLPPWVFKEGIEVFKENLTNPEKRKQIINEFKDLIWELVDIPWFLKIIPKALWLKLIMKILPKRVIITSMLYKHEYEGKTLKETVESLYPGVDIYNATLNLLREEEGAIIISMFLMKVKDIIKLMKCPYLMFSTDNLAPAIGKPHPRVLGTYPRILGRCVKNMKLLSLEEAIYKMTGFPAKKLKINDRGIIKIGNKADIVIFDPNTIEDTATHQNPISFPIGIDKVIVNGKIVVDNNKHTHELPGEIIKFKPQ